MRLIQRGIKNAFRNSMRTLSVALILALSIGLALIMLLSYQTVENRIKTVKASVGNTITINPAGAQGFQGGGEPLTNDQMDLIKTVSHVTNIQTTLQDRLTPESNTSLASAIEAGTIGTRNGRQVQLQFRGPGGASGFSSSSDGDTKFTIPIMVTGTSDASTLKTGESKITDGDIFSKDSNENVAVVGTDLATKNNLSVGSTFTAYNNTTIKVLGIYDSGNKFGNSNLYMPIKTVQTLSEQTNQISMATVTVDSIENTNTVVDQIKNKLGTDKADVTSNLESAANTLAPLENIKTITLYSLIGALAAGAIITLLIMMMIVRERRREIGVLKAIGSSNIGIVGQFATESLVLTLLGSLIGGVLGIVLSNPVLSVLVANSTSSASTISKAGGPVTFGGPAGAARVVQIGGALGGGIRDTVSNLHANAGFELILYGFLAAIVIAIVGSAIPAWLIAKVKPAEVMRAE